MGRTPEEQAAIDARKADTDRWIATARALAGDDPERNAEIDQAVADVEASRKNNP
jgi:hypothetical protein